MELESRRLHEKNSTDFKQDVKQIQIKYDVAFRWGGGMKTYIGSVDQGSTYPISVCLDDAPTDVDIKKRKSMIRYG